MNKTCDACGKDIKGGVGIGGALLCRPCSEDVKIEIDRIRAEGKQVNALGIARKMYRETHSTGDYQLRDIPKELWDKAKHKAVDEGISVRDVVLKALKAYLD